MKNIKRKANSIKNGQEHYKRLNHSNIYTQHFQKLHECRAQQKERKQKNELNRKEKTK